MLPASWSIFPHPTPATISEEALSSLMLSLSPVHLSIPPSLPPSYPPSFHFLSLPTDENANLGTVMRYEEIGELDNESGNIQSLLPPIIWKQQCRQGGGLKPGVGLQEGVLSKCSSGGESILFLRSHLTSSN